MPGFGAIMRLLCGNCITLREVPDYALLCGLSFLLIFCGNAWKRLKTLPGVIWKDYAIMRLA